MAEIPYYRIGVTCHLRSTDHSFLVALSTILAKHGQAYSKGDGVTVISIRENGEENDSAPCYLLTTSNTTKTAQDMAVQRPEL